MAKYDIIRSCGCSDTVDIGGKVSERERLADYQAKKECEDCARARAQQEASELNSGECRLNGSAKQIVWAHKIRAEFMTSMASFLAKLTPVLPDDHPKSAMQKSLYAVIASVASEVEAQKSAAWWIENAQGATFHFYVRHHSKFAEFTKGQGAR